MFTGKLIINIKIHNCKHVFKSYMIINGGLLKNNIYSDNLFIYNNRKYNTRDTTTENN